jgi:NADPH-dependent F420 reductase
VSDTAANEWPAAAIGHVTHALIVPSTKALDKRKATGDDWTTPNRSPRNKGNFERKHFTVKIAIIGAGNVGKALATSIQRAGHDVVISASTAESAEKAAQELGVRSAQSNAQAVEGANVVVLAVPYAATDRIVPEIAHVAADRVIIDVTNPLTADYSGLATETSAAEEIQQRLPDAKVIKAFNTLLASNQANPSADVDAFVAGDDADAKQAVMSLADAMGLSPVDVGPLKSARYLEGMAFINIGLNARNGWNWTSAWKLER